MPSKIQTLTHDEKSIWRKVFAQTFSDQQVSAEWQTTEKHATVAAECADASILALRELALQNMIPPDIEIGAA